MVFGCLGFLEVGDRVESWDAGRVVIRAPVAGEYRIRPLTVVTYITRI
jgi:hypothetical protein